MKRWLFVLVLILALVLGACAPKPAVVEEVPETSDGAEVRFAYYADGNEADVMQGLLDAFMAENPEITVVLDVVPYDTIDAQLPIQVETGEGPDMARITNFGA
jgi:ABC-type glycerol-3-phosphate transport system substrate-binding protein